jgi:hypothetical protein
VTPASVHQTRRTWGMTIKLDGFSVYIVTFRKCNSVLLMGMLKRRKWRSRNEQKSEKYEEGGVTGDKKGGNERKEHLRRKNNTEWEE